MKGTTAIVAGHLFFDVVGATVGDDVEVAIGVVEFGVDDVLERGDLWEAAVEHVEQGEEARGVVLCHDDDDHPVAERGVADDEVAEEARVVAYVVVFQMVLFGRMAHGEAYVVAGVGLEGAVLDGQDLVEELWDMEPEGALGGLGDAGSELFGGAPGFGGEGEFQLVAVVVDVVGAADGAHAGAVDVAEAFEVVAHLALLGFELRGIVEDLPFASATDAEMGAAGLDTGLGIVVEADGASFGVALFLFEQLDVHHISRDDEGYKHNKAVDFGNGLTFCACIGDGYLLKQG